MLTIREEVQALVRVTERLLSPITLGEVLNEDELSMVAMCAQNLAEQYASVDTSDKNRLQSEGKALLRQSNQVNFQSRAVIDRTLVDIQTSKATIEGIRRRMYRPRTP